MSIRVCILALVSTLLGCGHQPAKPRSVASRVGTVTQEPQTTHFSKNKKGRFPDSGIVRAVGYSFLDEEEDDTTNRGQLITIMPRYAQYLNRKDPHPKAILTRPQTQELLAIINDPGNYSNTRAECDNPRNCFCFYNSKNEIVGWYEVCFECGVINCIPEFTVCRKGGLTDRGVDRLKAFCTVVKLNTGKP
jgi:hypothetical protein